MNKIKLAFDTKSSVAVKNCQICDSSRLKSVIFIGYMPPVNTMPTINTQPQEQPSYPAEILYCPNCHLVQLGLIVDPKILFPSEYPYTSSTTKVLRDNFAQLYKEASKLIHLKADDLVLDIGSNDGNLLSNFKDKHRVLGITPEKIGTLAIEKGIPTIIDYFNDTSAEKIKKDWGLAKIITATNVYAHIENIDQITTNIISLLKPDGVFISESHYLFSLLKTLQYDTIYHEHLRYYSLHSLKYLLNKHGLEIFHAKRISPHGGSIRVYAARKGQYKVATSVKNLLNLEAEDVTSYKNLLMFRDKVVESKLRLYNLFYKIKKEGGKIYGISAPSRASTLINYTGIDDGIIDCVLEIPGSYKIGKYVPGTIIPILEETKLFSDQPEYALLLSWHIAKELMPKLKAKGFKGDFIIPLPKPKIVKNKSVA